MIKESCNLTGQEPKLATANQKGSLRYYIPLMTNSMYKNLMTNSMHKKLRYQLILSKDIVD